jgi:hypothetical protein
MLVQFKDARSTNPPARVSFQALATLVVGSANRIKALLVLRRTPVSVQPLEVLLDICFYHHRHRRNHCLLLYPQNLPVPLGIASFTIP